MEEGEFYSYGNKKKVKLIQIVQIKEKNLIEQHISYQTIEEFANGTGKMKGYYNTIILTPSNYKKVSFNAIPSEHLPKKVLTRILLELWFFIDNLIYLW